MSTCATESFSKWPTDRQQVLFDLRSDRMLADHKDNVPWQTLSDKDFLWGDARSKPQLMFKNTQLPASWNGSVHYLKTHNVVLHISTITDCEEENDPATG